jgi:hypothetical protein
MMNGKFIVQLKIIVNHARKIVILSVMDGSSSVMHGAALLALQYTNAV